MDERPPDGMTALLRRELTAFLENVVLPQNTQIAPDLHVAGRQARRVDRGQLPELSACRRSVTPPPGKPAARATRGGGAAARRPVDIAEARVRRKRARAS